MADRTETEVAQDFAAVIAVQGFKPEKRGAFAVVPDGFEVKSLEEFQSAPDSIEADHKFVDVLSLAAYLKRFPTPETMICADYQAAKISAVIDGDAPSQPSHKRHKAGFKAMLHDVTEAWLGICGKGMTQIEFGLFLEDHAVDVVTPDAADVMDMVMKFDAIKKVEFKSSTRLSDGSRQFQYIEENEGRGGVVLPDHFVVMAPVYRGMEAQRIKFMVRYRINDGKLRFQVEMHDKDTVMRTAFDRCVDALKGEIGGDTVIFVTG
jgi:uncharacterized protein YfdQ (DUF2303 family)